MYKLSCQYHICIKGCTIGLLLIIISLFAAPTAIAQTVVIDAETHQPLGGVMVFTSEGSFVDFTDSLGYLPQETLQEDTIILQHLAYKSIKAALPTATIVMQPTAYNIKEVTVSAKADYIKLRGYYREYYITNDSMTKYEDGMVDYYIPMKDGRTRVKYLMSRQGEPGESPLSTVVWGDGVDGIQLRRATVMQYIAAQQKREPHDTVSYVLTDTLRGIVTAYWDLLGNDPNHTVTINLLFINTQLTDMDQVAVYQYNPEHMSQLNLISCVERFRGNDKSPIMRKAKKKSGIAKGKMYEDEFSEFYVVERDMVSKEQMKADFKSKADKSIECVIPPSAPQLSDRLLEQLADLKARTRQKWEGKNIVVPTKENM